MWIPDLAVGQATEAAEAAQRELAEALAGHGVVDIPPTDSAHGHSDLSPGRPSAVETARRRIRRLAGAGMTPSLCHLLDLDLSASEIQALGLSADDNYDDDDADDQDAAGFKEL